MKKEMTLRISLKQHVKLYVANKLQPLADILSDSLEEPVSVDNLLRILHAVLAFTILVFSYGNVWASVLFLLWFVATLIDCRRAGMGSSQS